MYHARIQSLVGVRMEVDPPVLMFEVENKVPTFWVKFSPTWKPQGDYTFGSLTWGNEQKVVRIPVAA